ncbi:hypothetical protein C3E97_020385 [Pseudomonas sp. MWU12-2115]|uniref:hypothetical protein n=1 Tax=unclassified Pseudomonas TaxID=196821 RepID=UPI000DD4F5E3|nr:hypothetical protein [Pseudomonas sp. MWU12-2020]RBB99631.1 hypothetical protein C3E97_020385 [Pseudomonas sp. MWU12-2115]
MPEIKERPILFSAPMVRAILDGRKTVTRRPVKGCQIPVEDTSVAAGERHRWMAIAQRDPRYGFGVFGATEAECAKELEEFAPCPYGRRGERLWVREAWAADAQVDAVAPRDLSQGEPIWYPADNSTRQTGCSMIARGRGRTSIHMPRWASRILLEITDVRVERLQDISEVQAMAEGISAVAFRPDDGWPICTGYMVGPDDGKTALETTAAKAFAGLWNSTGGDWDANPWCWVVEFKRVQP